MNRVLQASSAFVANLFSRCPLTRSCRPVQCMALVAAVLFTCGPRPLLAFTGFGTAFLVENAGLPPKDIAVGDVNRDGAADLIMVFRLAEQADHLLAD